MIILYAVITTRFSVVRLKSFYGNKKLNKFFYKLSEIFMGTFYAT